MTLAALQIRPKSGHVDVHQVARVPIGALQALNYSGTSDEVSVLLEGVLGQTRTVSVISEGFLPLPQVERRRNFLAISIVSAAQRNVALFLKGFNGARRHHRFNACRVQR
jgi:hypothetical protein